MMKVNLKTLFRALSLLAGVAMIFGLVFGAFGGASGVQAAEDDLSSGERKVLATKGVLDTNVPGIRLWHDYGPFALYAVTETTLSSFSQDVLNQISFSDEMDMLLFDAYPFNTQSDSLNIPDAFEVAKSDGSALHLIQFVGPIKDSWLESVEAAGASLVHYIANYGYLVWADADARSQLASLVQAGDFLQFSAPYQTYFKFNATLRVRLEKAGDPNEVVPVLVQMYQHPGRFTSESAIESLAVSKLADWTSILRYQNAIFEIKVGDLMAVAELPDVYWIGERLERELLDEVQDQIIAGNVGAGTVNPPGYLNWLTATIGVSTNAANYPIVDITDDGIGNGLVNSGDSTLHEFGSLANPTRLAYVGNCTNSASGEGLDGHGHINTSIVGGYANGAAYSGFPHQDPNNYQRGLGINPFTQLAGTRIFDPGFDLSGCSGTDTGLIKSIQDNGAQINSNSWGCSGCAGSYDDSSQAYDVGTRDADLTEAGNQELITIFSAGNSGPGAGTLGTPGNGKNMLSVGAGENVRPGDEDGAWTDGCAIGPTGADNWQDVISFSSRGPSPGGRAKPETIGPGTHIQGTASTNAAYNGSGVCDQYRPSGQTTYAASSGTSHSAPAVAGVASLVYWWLENNQPVDALPGPYDPSPAVVKAYIMNHPTYMTGVGANDTLPSNSQGYGIPNMGVMFDGTQKYVLDQAVLFDNTGETWTWNSQVADPSKPVRIMLNYTDEAGAIGVSPQVNDLNLSADVGGTTYLGNDFSGQWSTTGGSADSANNYEAVFLPAGTTGAISLTVTAFNIVGDGVPNTGDGTDQDFAIVCYNCSVDYAIDLEKTVGTDPSICAVTDTVTLPFGGGDVTYCYRVVNMGAMTLTTHDLVDSELGILLSGFSFDLNPGAATFITETANITVTTVNSATWTAGDGIGTAFDSDSATVNVEPPMPVIQVSPGALASPQAADAQFTRPMTITNIGSGNLDWNIFEDATTILAGTLPDGTPVQAVDLQAVDPTATEEPMPMGDNSWSTNPNPVSPATPPALGPLALEGSGSVTITHSLDQSIISLNSVSCNNGVGHTDNSYLRRFTLSDFGITGGMDVSLVRIGIESAAGSGGTQPATVNLYTWDPADPFIFANFTIIGTANVTVADQSLTILDIPITGTAPPGSTLVVEFFTPNGQTPGNLLFVGSNNLGQTDTTFLAAADCGAPEPTDTAALGFPNMHMVLNVVGTTGPTACDAPDDIPWASTSPISGTTTGGSSNLVDVIFDSTGLAGGVYTGTLCVDSNDVGNPQVQVPLTMTVVATPTYGVDLSASQVLTGLVGTTVTYTLQITNTGDVADVYTITTSGNAWPTTLSQGSIVLDPGATAMMMAFVDVPAGASNNDTDTATVLATSQGDPVVSDTMTLMTIAVRDDILVYLPTIPKLFIP